MRNQMIANIAVLALIVLLVLLAQQAEPVTATLAYVYAVLFSISLLVVWFRK